MNHTFGRMLTVAAVATIAGSACTAPAPPDKPLMLIYGDSLTVQSEVAATSLYGGRYRLAFRAEGGTAMCDRAPQAAADRIAFRPARVVIAFTGNSATCAAAPFLAAGSAGILANYKQALDVMADAYAGLPVTVVGSPAMHDNIGWFPFNGNPQLNAMYRAECARLHLTYNAGADDALTPGHVFRTSGRRYFAGPIVVLRSSDGIHLTADGAMWYGSVLGA